MPGYGPGPGAYMLPPCVGFDKHDVSRYRNPQYSMGIRLQSIRGGKNPGPQYEVGCMTRYGKHTPPAFSLAPRLPNLEPFKTPAPGTYSPEKAPRMREPRPPAYSIYSRQPPLKKFQIPAPNQYALPSVLGPKVPNKPASSAFTMAPRLSTKLGAGSPGPAQYSETKSDLYKNKLPAYTMAPRCAGAGEGTKTPGPAAYLPKFPQVIPGGYSFGIKTSRQPYITAADNMPCIDE